MLVRFHENVSRAQCAYQETCFTFFQLNSRSVFHFLRVVVVVAYLIIYHVT